MRLPAAHEEINSMRIMPRDDDPPLPRTIAKSSVGHSSSPRDATDAVRERTTSEKEMKGTQSSASAPSSPRKRTMDRNTPSKTNRKRSRSSSPGAAVPEPHADTRLLRHGDDLSLSSQHLAGQTDRSVPQYSRLDIGPGGLGYGTSTRPSGLREPVSDSLSMLEHQAAALTAARHLRQQQQQQQPLHIFAIGGNANLFCAPSSVHVGLGYGPTQLPSLSTFQHPLQVVPGPAYPDMLHSMSGINVLGRDSTFPIGGINRAMLLDEAARFTLPGSSSLEMHAPRSWPMQQPSSSSYAAQSVRVPVPAGLMVGSVGMGSDARLNRGSSLESATDVDRTATRPSASPVQRKNQFTPFDDPTLTSVESHSIPSSSATSFSSEALLRRDAAQAVAGTAHISIPSTSSRNPVPLGIDEDVNWLSEFHCFVRRELVEVFRADRSDCKVRNFNVAHEQVGIRCKFCAHRTSRARALRSAAYPSSIAQIYQSFTMMLRDHFPNCDALPRDTRVKFMTFREIPAQGATDSKRYWVYAARKIGMVDTPSGIKIDTSVLASTDEIAPFGSTGEEHVTEIASSDLLLTDERDRHIASDFLILLMQQARVVQLMPSERIGSRRNLPKDLAGFACRYCCEKRRLGQCRMFPSRRRALPGKVSDLYDHLQRCFLCPANLKRELATKRDAYAVDPEGDDLFFDRIWRRLGHDS